MQSPAYWMPIGHDLVPVFSSIRGAVEYLEWHGRRYSRYPHNSNQQTAQYFRASSRLRTWLHRDAWEFVYGKPVGDRDIHHVDANTLNNRFDNLKRLTRSRHMSITHNGATRSPQARIRMAEAQRLRMRQIQPRLIHCTECNQPFTAKSPKAELCSNRCALRRSYRKRRPLSIKAVVRQRLDAPH